MTGSSNQSSASETWIDICICTYRREELRATLLSLGQMNLPEKCRIRVVVADNDIEPSAKDRVADIASELPFEVRYIHSPAANISLARNACLDASTGDYVAFIDDDETASEGWIERLLTTARDTNADAVLGPVQATYASDAPRWMSKGDFHSTFPVWVRGEILTGYTCNVLLRRSSTFIGNRRFSLALGRSGGEDTQYFTEIHEAGGRISYAPQAWVFEPVPQGAGQIFVALQTALPRRSDAWADAQEWINRHETCRSDGACGYQGGFLRVYGTRDGLFCYPAQPMVPARHYACGCRQRPDRHPRDRAIWRGSDGASEER